MLVTNNNKKPIASDVKEQVASTKKQPTTKITITSLPKITNNNKRAAINDQESAQDFDEDNDEEEEIKTESNMYVMF